MRLNFNDRVYNRLYSLCQRLHQRLLVARVKCSANVVGRIVCGSNASIYNHGCREHIVIQDGLILDGILECYNNGRIDIGPFSYIGKARVFAAGHISIGRGVQISDNVIIFDSNLHSLNGIDRFNEIRLWHDGVFPDVYAHSKAGFVTISDYVWIGANSVITKGIILGEGAIVAAGSVVTSNVEPYSLVGGNPARVIRRLIL